MSGPVGMLAALYVSTELSDDDIVLSDVASECGYDVRHAKVLDVDEPLASEWHEQPCLLLKLTLVQAMSADELSALLEQLQLSLSHPSLSAFNACALTPWAEG